jgi:hypothetical protein
MDEKVRLKLLAGLPLPMNNICKIYPLSLRTIAEIEYEEYNKYLMYLISEPKDFGITIDEGEQITTFDIIVSNMIHGNDEFRNIVNTSLKLFIKEDIQFLNQYGIFVIGNIDEQRFICRDNFELLKNNLKIMNCIGEQKPKEEVDLANDKAKEIYAKIQYYRNYKK